MKELGQKTKELLTKRISSLLLLCAVLVTTTIISFGYASPLFSLAKKQENVLQSSEFGRFLETKGISKEEYANFNESKVKHADSMEDVYYEIETLDYIGEELLFAHPSVKEVYRTELEKVGEENKDLAWQTTIMKAYSPEMGGYGALISESLSRYADMNKLFTDKFFREPTSKEQNWMKQEETIKYALYGGVLGREINSSEENMIDQDNGYLVLNVTEEGYKEYMVEYKGLASQIYNYLLDYLATK